LVKVYLELLLTPDLDFPLVEHFSNMLFQLLRKVELLTPIDLVVDWQPIYKLYLRIYEVDERSPIFAPENIGNGFFKTFVSLIRRYFKASSTSEMLEEWRPLMCLFDTSMKTAFDRFELFLPTLMDPSRFDKGFKLWIDEFLNLWISMQRPRAFEPKLIALLSRAAFNSIGFFDWNPYIPQIFSQLLGGLNLPVSLGANGNGGGPTKSFATDTLNSIAVWLVAMINPYTTCMDYIRRLFATLRSFYYPSNTGRWSANLYMFLRLLPDIFAKRLHRERREKHLWFACVPDEYRLREEDITKFVDSMKDCVFTAIFSKTNSRDAAKAFQSLCFLRPELMLPYLVDNFYLSLKSLIEPHRFTTILQCFNLVSRELIDYNRLCPSLQTHVVQLLIHVLPGIDPSDINKSVITLQFLTIILTSIPIVNCSGAVSLTFFLRKSFNNDLEERLGFCCSEHISGKLLSQFKKIKSQLS
jgi:proteasome activator subunit 4